MLSRRLLKSLLPARIKSGLTEVRRFSRLPHFPGDHSKIQSSALKPPIAQGISGLAELITGNFSYFTKREAHAIETSLARGKVFVVIFDRDYIPVPANERAMWIREYFNHHQDLEVRIAYGAPFPNPGNENAQVASIKRQLPPHVQISAVRCANPHSELLAQSLNVPMDSLYHLENAAFMEETIRQNPECFESLLFPDIARRVISPFQQVINEQQFIELWKSEREKVREDMEKLNPDHPNRDVFFRRTPWNLSALNQINLPVVTGRVNPEDRPLFSNRTNVQVFDMPVCMENTWKIPVELSPWVSTMAKIVAAESLSNENLEHCNVYLTTDCGVVFPSGYARREGRHVDGFLNRFNARPGKDGIIWGDNTYIVSDSRELQTELYPGPFDLSQIDPDNIPAVLEAFEKQGRDMAYRQVDAYDIARLTVNNVHAVHPNLSGHFIQRSFLKMTFSERLFNRGGNTINPALNYRLMYVPRDSGRNTQNFMGAVPAGFLDMDLKEVDFKNLKFPACVSQTPFPVQKKPDIRIAAVPATDGEMLETKVDGHIVTTNIARAGDMKVIRDREDRYFLGACFSKLYKPAGKDQFFPVPRTLYAVRVLQNISFPASWGTRQNIPAGGYIVEDFEGNRWGVHQKSFEATYMKMDELHPDNEDHAVSFSRT